MRLDVTRRDVAWSYFNLGLTNAVNLLLLPLLLLKLTPAEVGLWFVFSAIGSLAVVLDLGMMTTFSRQVTFVWCGASELRPQGFEESSDPSANPNFPLLRELLVTLRIAYLGIAALALVAGGVLGSWHVIVSLDGSMRLEAALGAWAVYLLAVVINLAFSYWSPTLRGIGAVAQSHQANVVGKVLQLILTVVLLAAGWGLLGVSIAYLVSTFAARVVAVWFFSRHHDLGSTLVNFDRPQFERVRQIVQLLWPVSARQGVVSVSQYVLAVAPVLVASAFLSLEAAAMVGLTVQLLNLVKVFSNGLFNAYLPLFARMRLDGNRLGLLGLFARSFGVSSYLMLAGGCLILLLANPLLGAIGSEVSVLPWEAASVYFLAEFMANQTALSTGFLATGNRVPMHLAYALTVGSAIALQVLLVAALGWGVWGIVLPTLMTFGAYHGWIWFLRVARDLGVSAPTLIKCALACSASRVV